VVSPTEDYGGVPHSAAPAYPRCWCGVGCERIERKIECVRERERGRKRERERESKREREREREGDKDRDRQRKTENEQNETLEYILRT